MIMSKVYTKRNPRTKRHARIRARVSGTGTRPRLSVYRSNTDVYAQIIDDTSGKTIAAADSRTERGSRQEKAAAVGKKIAELTTQAGITTVVFDRGGFQYHGTVKALADGARHAGLEF